MGNFTVLFIPKRYPIAEVYILRFFKLASKGFFVQWNYTVTASFESMLELRDHGNGATLKFNRSLGKEN